MQLLWVIHSTKTGITSRIEFSSTNVFPEANNASWCFSQRWCISHQTCVWCIRDVGSFLIIFFLTFQKKKTFEAAWKSEAMEGEMPLFFRLFYSKQSSPKTADINLGQKAWKTAAVSDLQLPCYLISPRERDNHQNIQTDLGTSIYFLLHILRVKYPKHACVLYESYKFNIEGRISYRGNDMDDVKILSGCNFSSCSGSMRLVKLKDGTSWVSFGCEKLVLEEPIWVVFFLLKFWIPHLCSASTFERSTPDAFCPLTWSQDWSKSDDCEMHVCSISRLTECRLSFATGFLRIDKIWEAAKYRNPELHANQTGRTFQNL